MNYLENDISFGLCQLGEWDEFNPQNIECQDYSSIDLSNIPNLIKTLETLDFVYIISKFSKQDDINTALELSKICCNYKLFTIVLTPENNTLSRDSLELQNNVDVFLRLKDAYFENQLISDPVSYAINYLLLVFDEYIDDTDPCTFYDSNCYKFSKSGNANLVQFEITDADYDPKRGYQLPNEIETQVFGKRLAFIRIKSGGKIRWQTSEAVTTAFKVASGNMISAKWISSSYPQFGKRVWACAILSNLDNPSNKFGSKASKTTPQKNDTVYV